MTAGRRTTILHNGHLNQLTQLRSVCLKDKEKANEADRRPFNAAGIIQVLQEAVALTPTAAVLLTLSLGRLTVSTQPEQFVVEMIRSFAIESVVDVVVRLCPDGVVVRTTSMLDTPLLRQDPAEPRVN